MLPGADPENVYLHLAGELLHPVLVGLLLASIFAAIMSTADSQLLVAASSLVRDIYQKLIKRDKEIWITNIAIILWNFVLKNKMISPGIPCQITY